LGLLLALRWRHFWRPFGDRRPDGLLSRVNFRRSAHVTNTMGQAGDDFKKGDADGTRDALAVLAHLINAFRAVS